MLRTRFAPAPTGVLHLGHVVNAIHVWGLAKVFGASVVLRIEDHDRERARPAYEAAILDDLDWLGFFPDLFPTSEFRAGRCDSRQRDREAVYLRHAARLIDDGRVYGCVCTRQDLNGLRVPGADSVLAYPGTCRTRGIAPGPDVTWRVRLDDDEPAPFTEILAGVRATGPVGDPAIRDRRGNWTYQFAVTVDDLEQDIDLVVRGRDLLESTPLQVKLAVLLGRTRPPLFAHHALLMRTATEKLSKSAGDTGVSVLRDAGWTPAEVIGSAASRVNLIPGDQTLHAADVGELFGGVRRPVTPPA